MPTRKAPTLSGATYDNATSPPVAGRVPGRRGDARSHGGPAGPVVPAAPWWYFHPTRARPGAAYAETRAARADR